MKQYKFKSLFLALFAVSLLQAQVYEDTKKSSFKVSKNAVLEIDARHTDVTIEIWNKKTVAIEAHIEVEGIAEKSAKSIIKKWEFEALANKDKVKIISKSGDREFFVNRDVDLKFEYLDFPEIDIDLEALSKIDFRQIEIPDINIEHLKSIEIPDIPDLKILENFDFSNYKKDSSYVIEWKERVREGVDKLEKSEWRVQIDSLRNSKEFKHEMELLKVEMEQLRNNLKNEKNRVFIDKKELEKIRKDARRSVEFIKKEWNQGKRDSLIIITDKIKNEILKPSGRSTKGHVKKHLKIMVPSSMKFDLNIRHGKVKLPKGASHVSANISYGKFISEGLGEGKHEITINHAPVRIQSVSSGAIHLKNVPYAWFGTFSNASLLVNSGEVIIDEMGENGYLNQKFGTVSIHHLVPEFKQLNLVLDYAKGSFTFAKTPYSFIISNKDSKISNPSSFALLKNTIANGVGFKSGYQLKENSSNELILTGIYSDINIE